jgi:lysophospholipase L1-like esterase
MRNIKSCLIVVLSWLMFAVVADAQTLRVIKSATPIASKMFALPVHVGGRVVIAPNVLPLRGKSYTHQWPGIYFEASFNGPKLVLKFADPYNEYRLFVDGGAALAIKQVGATDMIVTGLGAGVHRVRLEKVTESIGLSAAFQGFFVPASSNVAAAKGRKRQIEFIGDSNMTGYGLRSKSRTCTQEEIRLLSDTQRSYPALSAKYFGADYQVNAASGRGMVRNFDGFSPEIALPKIYPSALMDNARAYRDAMWKPQITFIALGDNDFFTPLNPNDQWRSSTDLFNSYIAGYKGLLAQIHTRNPNTALVIWWPELYSFNNVGSAANLAGQKSVVAAAKSIGFKSVAFIPTKDLGLAATACDYHASASDHQKLKLWLVTYLRARPALWQGQK